MAARHANAGTILGEAILAADGGRREFTVALVTCGDEFQERVWALLREIPYGQTTTYGQIVEMLGDRTFAQRVEQTVGRKQVLLELEEPAAVSAGKLF
jgi:O6-methylguanine-DNA--protein-cysteine methyltransferase